MKPVHIELFNVYDGPYHSVYVDGVLADFMARDNAYVHLLTRAYRQKLCALAGPAVTENDLVFTLYPIADALSAKGLDANDVAEDYAACQALGVPPMPEFNRLPLADYEALAPTLFSY